MTKQEAIEALAEWYAKFYAGNTSDYWIRQAAADYASWYSRNVAALAVNSSAVDHADVIAQAEALTIAQIERLAKDE